MNKVKVLMVVYLPSMGAELCCGFLALSILSDHLGLSILALILILLLYPISFLFKALVLGLITGGRAFRVFIASLGIAGILLVAGLAARDVLVEGYSPAGLVLQILICGAAWWAGNSLATEEFHYRDVGARFQVALLFLLMAAAIYGGGLLAVILFFVLTMISLAAASWASPFPHGTRVLYPPRTGHILAGSLVLLWLPVFILLALSPDVARAIIQGFSAVGNLMTSGPPPAYGQGPEIHFSCSFSPEDGEGGLPSPLPGSGGSSGTDPMVFWLIVGVVLAFLLFFVVFTIRKIRASRQVPRIKMHEVEKDRVNVSLRTAFAGFFKSVLRGIRRAMQTILDFLIRRRTGAIPVDESTASVGRIYHSFLVWTARHAVPRGSSQTPFEYLKTLSQLLPGLDREVQVITGVYVKARYSRHPVVDQEFAAAKSAMERLNAEH